MEFFVEVSPSAGFSGKLANATKYFPVAIILAVDDTAFLKSHSLESCFQG